ncbi:MAG TPA: aromatic prenyltransferase [Chitinispirillaceae bacterium]|nr:aromatic prenyltransferase [Chitinispirillaceae bacterium]
MNWNSQAEVLYCQIVGRVPTSKRKIVQSSLRRGAESHALTEGVPEVCEDNVIIGFYEVTPEPFRPDVKANLKGLGIDYNKYIDNYNSRKKSSVSDDKRIYKIINDFETMSNRFGIEFNRSRVEPAILAYKEQFGRSPIAMRTTTKSATKRDFAIRYLDLLHTSTPDPLTRAIECGFTKDDGHPIYKLFEQAKSQCNAFGYGVDIEASAGFSKIWMAPSVEKASLHTITSLTYLPPAVKNVIPHFERFGLHTIGLLGFDFDHKTINFYVMVRNSGNSDTVYKTLLHDLGIQPHPPEVLDACSPAQVLYYSFSWTSLQVERVCFAVVCGNGELVPVQFHPVFKECLNDQVFMNEQKRCIYSVAWSKKGHYFKFDNDYNGMQALQLIEAGDVGVTPSYI